MSGSPLIKLGDLTKPATVLVEKISDALGGMFKPWQIVRVAKAEAAADQIRAESQIQITDLQRRALHRFLVEEGKKQSNIEEITAKSLPLLREESKPQDIEDDWITNFFDKSRIVSDTEMQQLWSRVLAGEANVPGSFSRRTVNLLSDLEKRDAEHFEKLCGFGWTFENRGQLRFPLVFDVRDGIYLDNDVSFGQLSDFESLGLMKFSLDGFSLRNQPEHITATYFGSTVKLTLPTEQLEYFQIGEVLPTQTGWELMQVCRPHAVGGFLEYTFKHWEEKKLAPRKCE